MMSFEQWWEKNHTGKYGTVGVLELAFKDVARQAWYACAAEIAQFVEDKFDFCGDEIVIAETIREHQ